jgi:hypothetical protein
VKSFVDVIGIFGKGVVGADVLATTIRANRYAVRNWKARNSIPPEHWRRVIKAARDRGFELTMDDLQRFAERKARQVEAAASP